MSKYYLYTGDPNWYKAIELEGSSIKEIVRSAVSNLRNYRLDLHRVLYGFYIYLGHGYSTLHDLNVLSIKFPKEFGEAKAWCTSPEMCGVDVELNHNKYHTDFYKYASILKHWRWEVQYSTIPGPNSCSYGVDQTIEEINGLEKFVKKYPFDYKNKQILTVKSINYYDKCMEGKV